MASLPQDSEDIYLSTKYLLYLLQNSALRDITYTTYFQWWHKSTYTEQCKGEKATEKGLTPLVGFKGIDEFEELKASIMDKFDKLGDTLKAKNYLYNAIQTVINATEVNYVTEGSESEPSEHEITEDSTTAEVNITEASEKKAIDPSESEVTEPSENELTEALTILKDIGIFDSSTNRPQKLH